MMVAILVRVIACSLSYVHNLSIFKHVLQVVHDPGPDKRLGQLRQLVASVIIFAVAPSAAVSILVFDPVAVAIHC